MSTPDFKFCPRCGTAVVHEHRFGQLREVCPNCKWIHFVDPKVAAAVLVVQDGRVLLVRRVGEPFRGLWTLPAGFINSGEDPAEAAARECLEETGLSVRVTRVFDIVAGREHPNGADFIIVYQAEIIGGEMDPGDDADAVEWFDKSNLPQLAFRATQKVLNLFMLDVRPSPIAGTWYEGNAKTLARAVDEYLNNAQLPALDGEVIGVIAPHAGHRYSGAVAGYAFAPIYRAERSDPDWRSRVEGERSRSVNPDLVAVISPFHNFANYPLLTTAHDAYGTPLGNVEVDKTALAELSSHLDIPITPVFADKEHSLEIELPFLQRALTNDFKLLPVMVRAQEVDIARKLGLALANVLKDKNALLVASTDLSHFYDQATAKKLDSEMLKRFESFDPESIFEAEHTGKAFACGHAAVAAVLWASRELGANKVQILHHATSGDVTGDTSSVVGYGAGVVLKKDLN